MLDLLLGFIESFWIGGTNLGNEPHFYWMGNKKPITFSVRLCEKMSCAYSDIGYEFNQLDWYLFPFDCDECTETSQI